MHRNPFELIHYSKKTPEIVFRQSQKFVQYDLKSSPYIVFNNSERMPVMGISMSSPTSGFRKWSEAHDPKIAGARAGAGEPAVIPVPTLDQAILTPKEKPHRPRRVPGAGTL